MIGVTLPHVAALYERWASASFFPHAPGNQVGAPGSMQACEAPGWSRVASLLPNVPNRLAERAANGESTTSRRYRSALSQASVSGRGLSFLPIEVSVKQRFTAIPVETNGAYLIVGKESSN